MNGGRKKRKARFDCLLISFMEMKSLRRESSFVPRSEKYTICWISGKMIETDC